MEKAKGKYRDIKFYSEKNKSVICVHTKTARDYAGWLEQQAWVESYEVNVPFEMDRLPNVNPVEIRPLYFQTEWASDFLLHFVDGRKAVREVSTLASLQKLATVEKLELSRRYWKAMGVDDWKLVFPPEEGGNQA
jgi:hypothetical protein